MSNASAWSYTSKATHWPLLSRSDWGGVMTYGPPASFACDYKAEAVRMTDDRGVEFMTRQIVYTEKADIKQGDMLLIGTVAEVSPVAAGAFEVRRVGRYADTFEQLRDDYEVAT